jgi:16S rRNA processing protein RimM
MEELVEIGRTKKPHGVKGELKLFVEDAYFEDLLHAKVVFIKVRGTFMPYFVESIRGGQFIILKLEDVDNREDALAIGGKEMALRATDIIEEEEREMEVEGLTFAHVIGYTIIDQAQGRVGKIEDVVEMPQQEMAEVKFNGKIILIPLHEDFIEKEDENNKELLMQLPEGLLDLYK